MKRGRKPKQEWEDRTDEEVRGRKIRCTCDEDPRWCEKHNAWG